MPRFPVGGGSLVLLIALTLAVAIGSAPMLLMKHQVDTGAIGGLTGPAPNLPEAPVPPAGVPSAGLPGAEDVPAGAPGGPIAPAVPAAWPTDQVPGGSALGLPVQDALPPGVSVPLPLPPALASVADLTGPYDAVLLATGSPSGLGLAYAPALGDVATLAGPADGSTVALLRFVESFIRGDLDLTYGGA